MAILLLLFLTATWFLLYSIPGNAVQLAFAGNPDIPPEAKEVALARLNLDQPVLVQFWRYITDFFQFDFGVSFSQYPRPVIEIIGERLPRTLVLFTTALATYYYTGFLAGKYLAWRRGKRGEMPITIGGVTLYTVFYPWFALMAIWFFAAQLEWLPISKFLDPDEWSQAPYSSNAVFYRLFLSVLLLSLFLLVTTRLLALLPNRRAARNWRLAASATYFGIFIWYWWGSSVGSVIRPYALDLAEHMILPVAVLTAVNFAGVMLLTRSSMLETMREDFILTARAKGVPERKIRDDHAARTALLPVTTSLVLAVATVIDGGILTEAVFSWPGMGEILVSSVTQEDIPLAVASFSLIGILAMFGHFAADVLYRFLDPRIRVT